MEGRKEGGKTGGGGVGGGGWLRVTGSGSEERKRERGWETGDGALKGQTVSGVYS